MIVFHRVASILTWILRRDRAEHQLDDDVRSFVELSAADKMRDGVPAAEARRLAALEAGGVEQLKEHVRAGRHGARLDDLGRDVRYAFRLFARQRTFAAVIVGTLALGIGANTAIFSIIDGVALRRDAALWSRAWRSGHTGRVGGDTGAHRRPCRMAPGAPRLTSGPDARPARWVRPRRARVSLAPDRTEAGVIRGGRTPTSRLRHQLT